MSSMLLIKTDWTHSDQFQSNDSIAVDSFMANPNPSPTYTLLEKMVELIISTQKLKRTNPEEYSEPTFMKNLTDLAIETLKVYKDPSFKRILRSFGWNGARFSVDEPFDLDKFQQALSNLYLKSQLKSKQEFFIDNFVDNDGINYLEKIASFVPDIVVECLRNKAAVCVGSELSPASYKLDGACMLIDISNFSKYSASMCSKGMKGLDELRKATSGLLGLFVKSVYEHDGDVIAFAGDALICIFPNKPVDEADSNELACVDAGFRALHCANLLRTVQFSELSTHIGVSFGELYIAFLGGHNGQWVYLVNGEPLAPLSSCIEDAKPHTVVITRACKEHIMEVVSKSPNNKTLCPANGSPRKPATKFTFPDIEFIELPSGNFLLKFMEKSDQMVSMLNDVGRLESLTRTPKTGQTDAHVSPQFKRVMKKGSRSTSIRNISLEEIYASEHNNLSFSHESDKSNNSQHPDRLLVDALVLFLPLPITLALHTEGNHLISELRQVTTLFMSLDSYDSKIHFDPVSLQPMFLAFQQVLSESGGFLRQFLVDDKGCVLIAMWGIPSYTYSNNCSRALYCAAAASQRLAELGHRFSMGITTGTVFCGTIGAVERCDYAGIGTEVNLAARFMAKAKGKIYLDEHTYINLNSANRELLSEAPEPLVLKGMPEPIRPYYYSSDKIPNLSSIDSSTSFHQNRPQKSKLLRKKIMVLLEKELDKVASRGVNNMSPSLYRQTLIRAPRTKSNRVRGLTLNNNVHCVILCGPPGSGKNTAAEYFRLSARERGIQTIDIKLQAIQRTIPYELIKELFLELVGHENFITSDEQSKVLDELIDVAYVDEDEAVKKSAKHSMETILGLHRSNSPDSKSAPGSPSLDKSPSSTKSQSGKSNISIRISPPSNKSRRATENDVALSSYGGFNEPIDHIVHHNNPRDKSDFSFYKIIASMLRSSPTALIIEDAHCCDELSWNELLLMLAGGDFDMSILLMMKTNPLHRFKSSSNSTLMSESPKIGKSASGATSVSNSSLQANMSFLSDLDTDVLVSVGLDNISFPAFKAMAKHPNTAIVEMKYLSEEEVRGLLLHTLDTENVSNNLVSFVYSISNGNPYWCKSVAQFIREHGLKQLEETLEIDKYNQYSSQHSLKVLVLTRREALSTWHQKVLKYASVLGLEFEVDILAEILPQTTPMVSSKNYNDKAGSKSFKKFIGNALEALERSGFIMCVCEHPNTMYGFQNDFIQRIIYELIPPSDAAAIHCDAAEKIEMKHTDSLRAFYPMLAHHYMMGQDRAKAFKYEVKSAALAVSSGAFNDGLMFANSAMSLASNVVEMDVLVELTNHAVQYLQLQETPVARNRFTSSFYEFVLGDSVYLQRNIVYQDKSFQPSMGLHASVYSQGGLNHSASIVTVNGTNQEKHLSKIMFTESFLQGNHISDQVITQSFRNLKQRVEALHRQMMFGQPSLTALEEETLLAAKTELMRSNTLLALPARTEKFKRSQSMYSATSEQHSSVPESAVQCCVVV